jgi:hypothetical protein
VANSVAEELCPCALERLRSSAVVAARTAMRVGVAPEAAARGVAATHVAAVLGQPAAEVAAAVDSLVDAQAALAVGSHALRSVHTPR